MEKPKKTDGDTASEARRIFDQFDLDRSGSIDDKELRLAIASMAPGLSVRNQPPPHKIYTNTTTLMGM